METVKKEKLLGLVSDLKLFVEQDNVPALIGMFDTMGFDSRKTTLLGDFIRDIILEDVTSYINKRGKELRVSRKGVYGDSTTDRYEIVNGVLYRNGSDAKWSSIGKLYQAYKKIHRIL